jgi:hypothetical protein
MRILHVVLAHQSTHCKPAKLYHNLNLSHFDSIKNKNKRPIPNIPPSIAVFHDYDLMNGKNRPLVTDGPVEVEK